MSDPDDSHEREAERVAGHVASGEPVAPREVLPVQSREIHRICAACTGAAEEDTLFRRATGSTPPAALGTTNPETSPGALGLWRNGGRLRLTGEATAQFEDIRRSSGNALQTSERAFFEPRLGRDLSGVRIHRGPDAAALASRIDARAFTHGNHIFFGRGEFCPGTQAGRRLLAHELVHTVQHASAGTGASRIARSPATLSTPPERPKITGTRKSPEPHIKGSFGSENRKWATFALIYAAVRDAEFNTISPGDLMRLRLEDLHALDRLCESHIKRYEDLAEQQVDPSFKPPPGAPDVMFGPAAKEYKEFREGVLGETLRGKQRRMKAPGLMTPWQDVIATKFARRDIGMAIALSWPVAEMIVNAELSGKDWQFGNAGVLRYGYLGESEIRTLLSESVPDGIKTQQQAAAYMHQRIIEIIKARGNYLPLALAHVLLDGGDGSEGDIAELVDRLQALHRNISKAIELASRAETGSSPLRFQPRPANLIFDWMRERANDKTAIYSAYAAFLATSDGVFSHTRAVMEEPVELERGR